MYKMLFGDTDGGDDEYCDDCGELLEDCDCEDAIDNEDEEDDEF